MNTVDPELDQPTDGSASDKPAQSSGSDLEAQIREILGSTLKSELDSRFSGLQSMQDKRLAALAKELRSTSLSREEQEEVLEREQAQETAKALQIAELIKRRKNAPEAVDFLLESMEFGDLDEQIQFIQSRLGSKAAAQVAQAVADADPASTEGATKTAPVPETDHNNPASRRSPAPASGSEMDDELADKILSNVGRGQFRRLLGR